MSVSTVALVFGGRSSEHSISCISAAAVWEALEAAGHRVLPIAITPHAGMVRYDYRPQDLRRDDLPVVDRGVAQVVFATDPSIHGVVIDGEPIWVDVVFPILHGPWGEDGTVQGLLELTGVPYVGSGVLASAVCMDKITLKTVLRAADIPVAPWVHIDESRWRSQRDQVLADCRTMGPALFVKPSRAGSSMGITRVDLSTSDDAVLIAAIDTATEHDPRVIVEQAMTGAKEIECGVRHSVNRAVEASVCAEIKVRADFAFYDFDAKYVADGAELVVPADLDESLVTRVRDLAVSCFQVAGCEGLARVDFFVTDEEIVVNEVNTMPGFTPISMYPRMWEASGVTYTELVDSLVAEALARPPGLR